MKFPRSKEEIGLNNRRTGFFRREVLVGLGFRNSDFETWLTKWKNFCKSAQGKGVGNKITFRLYLLKARTAGIKRPSEIGQTAGKHQMGRKTDRGPYTKSTCRFITVQQNQDERKLNGGTAVAVEKAAQVRRGQTKETDAHIASMAAKLTGRSAKDYKYLKDSARKRGRPYRVVSPEGKVYVGQGLNTLCTKLGLNQAAMSLVCRGEKLSHLGWTGAYTGLTDADARKQKELRCKTKRNKKGDM